MLILTAAQNPQPDYVALAMVLVLALIVAIMAIRKRFFTKAKEPDPAAASVPDPAEEPEQPAAPGSAGQVKLHGVEPKTAAMLMAIVANKMGKTLNELRFISIKEVE
jgi:3-oxoacyl-ACP reductase-like protein